MGFETVLEFEIPYWHPLAVHFPLVLLGLAAGAAAAYAVRGRAVWRQATLIFLLLGASAAWWAARTGHALEDAVEGEPMVERLVAFHETAAEWTVRVSVLALLVTALGTLWWRRRSAATTDTRHVVEPVGLRLAVLVGALLAAALVAYTGHLGGLMVWGVPA